MPDGQNLLVSRQHNGAIFSIWRHALKSSSNPERLAEGGVDAMIPANRTAYAAHRLGPSDPGPEHLSDRCVRNRQAHQADRFHAGAIRTRCTLRTVALPGSAIVPAHANPDCTGRRLKPNAGHQHEWTPDRPPALVFRWTLSRFRKPADRVLGYFRLWNARPESCDAKPRGR